MVNGDKDLKKQTTGLLLALTNVARGGGKRTGAKRNKQTVGQDGK